MKKQAHKSHNMEKVRRYRPGQFFYKWINLLVLDGAMNSTREMKRKDHQSDPVMKHTTYNND